MTMHPVTPTTSNPDRRWHAACSTCGWHTYGSDAAAVATAGATHLDAHRLDAHHPHGSLTLQQTLFIGGMAR